MLDEQALIELIFTPGFSTMTEVTALAGRGIGMDVVKSEVQNLGGRIEVDTTAGKGSRFSIFLPLTLGRCPRRAGPRRAAHLHPTGRHGVPGQRAQARGY